MTLLTEPSTPAKGALTVVTLDFEGLMGFASVVADSYFSQSAHISKVVVTYKSSAGQVKDLLFDPNISPITAPIIFSPQADNLFSIIRITLFDNDGGYFIVSNADIPSGLDIAPTEYSGSGWPLYVPTVDTGGAGNGGSGGGSGGSGPTLLALGTSNALFYSSLGASGALLTGTILTSDGFTGADLVTIKTSLMGADLSTLSLSGLNMSSSQLAEANLSITNCIGVNLSSSVLKGAVLTNSNFINANVSGSLCGGGCQFNSVTFFNTNFTSANLINTNFSASDLSSCTMTGALYNNSTVGMNIDPVAKGMVFYIDPALVALGDANVLYANTVGASGTKLTYGSLTSAGFVFADIKQIESSLSGADFSNVTIHGGTVIIDNTATTPNMVFNNSVIHSKLYVNSPAPNISCNSTVLTNAFSFSDVTNGSFSNFVASYGQPNQCVFLGDITGCNFSSSAMPTVSFAGLGGPGHSPSGMVGTTFSNADLTGTNFSHAVFTGAILVGANFTNANLTHANLYDMNMLYCNLTGADLTNAIFNSGTVFPSGFDPVARGMKSMGMLGTANALYYTSGGTSGTLLTYSIMQSYGFNFSEIVTIKTQLMGFNMGSGSGLGSHVDFSNANLTNATFAGQSDGCNFTNAIFTNFSSISHPSYSYWPYTSNFAGSDFTGATLVNSNFTAANLSGCTLTNTDFTGANLHGAVVDSSTVFGNANFTNADLSDIDFTDCNLSGCTLTGATYSTGTIFPVGFDPSAHGMISAILPALQALGTANMLYYTSSGASGTRLTLTALNDLASTYNYSYFDNLDLLAIKTQLKGVNFSAWYIAALDFSGADFTGASLVNLSAGGTFNSTIFNGATLTGASFNNAHLTSTDFTNANLTNASFSGATIDSVVFTGATLLYVVMLGATITNTSFYGVNMQGMYIYQTNFIGINLSNANMTGTNLSQSDFSNANLQGTNMTGVSNLYAMTFTGATYSSSTIFPSGFDPVARGMILV